jgi:hypothetical protein
MISFDLKCAKGHVFEARFKDGASFERQAKAKRVACAICGDAKVRKVPMAPAVASRKTSPTEEVETAKAARNMLFQMREAIEKNCEPVGDKFAEEARKMHYGESEKRNIYGQASPDEATALKDEGIEFGEIPWPQRGDA